MKKSISIMLVFCLIITMTFISVFNVSADTTSSGGEATATIRFTQQSEFCVYIPDTIDMDCYNYTFYAENINILSNQMVCVSITNLNENACLEFTSEVNGGVIQRPITTDMNTEVERGFIDSAPQNCVGMFLDGNTQSVMSFGLGQIYYNEPAKAGGYTATAQFEICLI